MKQNCRRNSRNNTLRLIRRIFLIIGVFAALSFINISNTLAFAISSRSSSRISPTTASRNVYWSRIRNNEKNENNFGRIQSSTIPISQLRSRQRRLEQSCHILYSTTESTNGDIHSTSIPQTNPTKHNKTSNQNNVNNENNLQIPKHVGLICDGNGRWATQRNLPRAVGHLEGARRLVDLIRALIQERIQERNSVECLTLYAFSTENWNRSPQEIHKIFEAIEFAAKTIRTAGELAHVDFQMLGDLSDDRIPKSLKTILNELEHNNNNNKNDNRLKVCLAINYGGRRDIVAACRSLAEAVQDGRMEASEITEKSLERNLATAELPPPDLIVRTGGEHRLSNFLLWESAYAEICVSQVSWPDFSFDGEWKKSLEWYSKRKRNFGGRNE